MALTGKGLDEVYKDLLELDNSNSGVPATSTATIKDGFGTSTSLGISEDKTAINTFYKSIFFYFYSRR